MSRLIAKLSLIIFCRIKAISDDVFDPSSELPNEYLYGRAGYLFAVLYVNKHISPAPFEESFIRKVSKMFIQVAQR